MFETDIFQQDLFERLGNDAWNFHQDFEPGKERPPELTDKRMKHDFGQKHLLHLLQRLKPYNHRVLWMNGKTPDLLDQFLDEEIAGWKENYSIPSGGGESMSEGIEHYHRGYGFWIFKSQVIDLLNMALKGSISAEREKQLQDIQGRFIPPIDCLRFCFIQYTAPTFEHSYFPDKKKSCKLVPIQLLDGTSYRLAEFIHQKIGGKQAHKRIKISERNLEALASLLSTSCINRILIPIISRIEGSKDKQEIATLTVLNQYFMKLIRELISLLQEIQGGAA